MQRERARARATERERERERHTHTQQRHFETALTDLPETADLVYLEYCYEDCTEVRYKPATPTLVRAEAPGCCAAIIYTAKGARKVLDLCTPVFQALDVMLPELIRRGMLEAYHLSPPLFHQDNAWGQGRDSKAADKGAHTSNPLKLPMGLSRPYCRQQDTEMTERMPKNAAITLSCDLLHILANQHEGGEGGEAGGGRGSGDGRKSGDGKDYCGKEKWMLVVVVGTPALDLPVPSDGSAVFFTAADGEQYDVFVGQLRPALHPHLILQVPANSVCFATEECRLKVVLESEDTITAVSDLNVALLPLH